jgi:hypothetical protein
MRYVRRRPRPREPETLGRASAVRRYDDGREVCLANLAGRAEYQRRKQLLWEGQSGLCAYCQLRMTLAACRLTGGAWQGGQRTGQRGDPQSTVCLRDDRLLNDKGEKINELVHKDCLRGWHESRGSTTASATPASAGISGARSLVGESGWRVAAPSTASLPAS